MLPGRSLLIFSSELLAPGRCWEGCKAGLSYQAESVMFRRVIQTEMGLCLKRNSLLMPACLTPWLQPQILASVLTSDMNNLPATASKEPVKSHMPKVLPAQPFSSSPTRCSFLSVRRNREQQFQLLQHSIFPGQNYGEGHGEHNWKQVS